MRRALVLLAALAALAAQGLGQRVVGGAGNATELQGVPISSTAPTNGTCLVYNSSSGKWESSSCSGTASTAWSALTSGTNTTAAMVVGTGASIAASGSGTIIATSTTGNAGTASALAATPTTCSAGSYATGVLASGNATGCTVAATGTVTSVAATVPSWLTVSGSPVTGSGTLALAAAGSQTANEVLATPNGSSGAVGLRTLAFADLPTLPWTCNAGLGDGLNAIAAGTYLQSTCYNGTGHTVTVTGIKCYSDNSGSSTMNVTNGAGTGLLTGAVTCSPSFASGTQSGTTTIASGDYFKFTFVADGTSKQTSWVIVGTY